MGRMSRNESCPEDEISVVHCINRCVRRGFLCGNDPVTGRDYEHRRDWIRQRFEFLAEHMAVEVLGFAILSNHFHIVLRNRPDVVSTFAGRCRHSCQPAVCEPESDSSWHRQKHRIK